MKKIKKKILSFLPFLFFFLLGGLGGYMVPKHVRREMLAGDAAGFFLSLFLDILLFLLALFVQIIVHEAGHMLFGFLSGYRFVSFRVGSLMWVKRAGKLRFHRFSLLGTGGQCLMTPPSKSGADFPFLLYLLGGSIANFVAALLCLALYFAARQIPYLALFLLLLSALGFLFAFANVVPFRSKWLENDGKNALFLRKDPAARRALFLQLKIAEEMTEGARLKDMEEDWFSWTPETAKKCGLSASVAVFACGRLMDMQKLRRAKDEISRVLSLSPPLPGLYRASLTCDLIYCHLLHGEEASAQNLYSKEIRRFLKSMRRRPCALRTAYACALLLEKDEKKAERLGNDFSRLQASYPYPGEIVSEQALMLLVKRRAQGENLSLKQC